MHRQLLRYVVFLCWFYIRVDRGLFGSSTSVSTGCGCDAVRQVPGRESKHLSSPASGDKPVFFLTIDCLSNTDYHLPKEMGVPVLSQAFWKTRISFEYTGCPGRNTPEFGRVFLKLKYTDITQNAYIQSWTVTEIMAREISKNGSCYTLLDYQMHIKTGKNMWFL